MDNDLITIHRIIVTYLAHKLGCDDKWFTTKQDFLFYQTPEEVINKRDGQHLIEWLESRLGLRPGVGF